MGSRSATRRASATAPPVRGGETGYASQSGSIGTRLVRYSRQLPMGPERRERGTVVGWVLFALMTLLSGLAIYAQCSGVRQL